MTMNPFSSSFTLNLVPVPHILDQHKRFNAAIRFIAFPLTINSHSDQNAIRVFPFQIDSTIPILGFAFFEERARYFRITRQRRKTSSFE